jgi:hypothetical protein
MKWIISILAVLVFTASAHAFELVEPAEYGFSDTVTVLSGEGKDQLMGAGTCFGNYYDIVSERGNRVGGLLASCAILGLDLSDTREDESVALIGIRLAEAFGLSLTVAYNPLNNEPFWGLSISMMEFAERLGGE